jgi:hypothetical protein
MDKAKQAAQRAQQVLDEQQTKFNEAQSRQSQQGSPSGGTTYDQQGRPIPPPSPSPEAAAPSTQDTGASDPTPSPADQTASPPGEGQEAAEAPPPTERPPRDDLNETPDPFKPIGG